jgi:hypothetical protein
MAWLVAVEASPVSEQTVQVSLINIDRLAEGLKVKAAECSRI